MENLFRATNGVDKRGDHSDNDSDDGDEGDYTVYECPGLAPVGTHKLNEETSQLPLNILTASITKNLDA